MSNLDVVRCYEMGTYLLYAAATYGLWRTRQPLYLGALVGATTVYGFDWVYCSKYFFNVTYNPDLVWIPGLNLMGVREPIAIPFAYGTAFGPFAVALVAGKDWFDRRFGVGGYLVVWVIGAVGVMLYEVPVVHLLHIWTYHQRSEHLIWGVPISDIWLAGNLVLISYAGLRWMQRWALIPAGCGWSLRRETTWKGIVMGAMPAWAAFYVTFLIQQYWYAYATPWVDAGRPF